MDEVIGQYKGQDIFRGTNEEVASQMRKIESISANDIAEQEPVRVPPVNPGASERVIQQTRAESGLQREADRQEREAQRLQVQTDQSRNRLQQTMGGITNLMQGRDEAEEALGLTDARLQAADITSRIEARDLALRRDIEKTQQTAGLSQTQINRRAGALERDAAREMADLAIVESASLRRVDVLQSSLDRKYEMQLDGLKTQLQFDTLFYQENRELMTNKQNQAFQLRIAQEERFYQEQKAEKDSIKQVALSAAQYGANPEEVLAISNAQTFEQAMGVGGSFLGEPFRLQVESQKFQQIIQTEQLALQKIGVDIQRAGLNLQQQQLEQDQITAANQLILTMSKEGRDELQKTQVYQNWEMRGLVANDLDNTLAEFAGTADRDALNAQNAWNNLANSDSAVNAIATQLVYSRNPQLRRAVALGDAVATANVDAQAKQVVASLTRGRNVQPDLLRDRVREIDTNFRSSVQAKTKVVDDIMERNPMAILPEYDIATVRVGTATKALDAELEQLENESLFSNLFQKNLIQPFNLQR